jgi:HEAT repeat protein
MPGVLQFAWMFSAALAALSCGVMAALIVARLLRQEYDRTLPDRSIQLTLGFLSYAKGESAAPALRFANRREADFILQTAIDVMRALDDDGRKRLCDLLRRAGLDVYYRRAAQRGRIPQRIAAIEFLRVFPGAETSRVLSQFRRSPVFRICIAALRALVETGDLPDLADTLKLTERAEGGRSLALFKIVAACVAADLPRAAGYLSAGISPNARIMLLKALGASGSWSAFHDVAEASLDPDPEVRAAALTSLRAMGAPAAVPVFVAATHDPDWQVRLKAVEGIGQLGKPPDRESIVPLLNDKIWWIRFRAAEAMRRLTPAPVMPPVPEPEPQKAQAKKHARRGLRKPGAAS